MPWDVWDFTEAKLFNRVHYLTYKILISWKTLIIEYLGNIWRNNNFLSKSHPQLQFNEKISTFFQQLIKK